MFFDAFGKLAWGQVSSPSTPALSAAGTSTASFRAAVKLTAAGSGSVTFKAAVRLSASGQGTATFRSAARFSAAGVATTHFFGGGVGILRIAGASSARFVGTTAWDRMLSQAETPIAYFAEIEPWVLTDRS